MGVRGAESPGRRTTFENTAKNSSENCKNVFLEMLLLKIEHWKIFKILNIYSDYLLTINIGKYHKFRCIFCKIASLY